MFLLQVLLVAFIFSCGDAQVLKQSQSSIVREVHKTARIECHVSGISFSNAYIHWYRQKPREAPERILYVSSGTPSFDKESDKGKFEAKKNINDNTCTLTLNRIRTEDAATYYCAYWHGTLLAKHYAHGEITITQTPEFSIKRENATVRMYCVLQGISENIASAIIHLYHQSPGEAPKRVLFFTSGKSTFDDNSQAKNFQVTIDPQKSRYTFYMEMLKFSSITQDVTATGSFSDFNLVLWIYRSNSHPKSMVYDQKYGDALELTQSEPSKTRGNTKTAIIKCQVTGTTTVIHWYRHKPGEGPERILYWSAGRVVYDKESDKKFSAKQDSNEHAEVTVTQSPEFRGEGRSACMNCDITGNSRDLVMAILSKYLALVQDLLYQQYQGFIKQLFYHFTLFISSLETGSKLYTSFCKAFRHSENTYNKIFGSGTKLVVTNKQATTTAQDEMLHHIGDSKETYVCLVHNFFPNVIRMYWTDKEGTKISDNVVQGEVWPPQEDADSYSVSSWLTVNKDINKEYVCWYEREGSGKKSIHTQLPTATPMTQADNCTASQASGKENFTHRTASLIYIVLLLKSSMYYVVVLFFIYRMRSPTKGPPRKH
ncbi:PREDICTED: TCR gamma alternate reading frame protein [Gavialis gangeticus]|uniref:TCR gamma alternate reading frame protein n=1 Tax=Gavialis gangeticus TaxID=94835 RepID=UPI00092E42A6|nr:PREDICTED: TCR gamma alternate reading frame protein [Gavialis gangeticus]